ncbi:MAG: hypothetical protein B5M48_04355 [Candidatus Omnitrophica bacterium 4484_213]|nr:MAG: hypothetical protein B5M48_04355 [Candidatus Omnitrophica bacterium 4484_213]
MKIGITGISAFVGYHLAKELVKEHQVIGFDCRQSELVKEINTSNFKFIQGDISDFSSLKNALKDVDLIYHLAAISSERLCRQDALGSFRVNVQGALDVLELARQGETKVIYASSGAVYFPSSRPHREEEADFTDKFYGTSKLIAERYCRLYNKNFGLPFVILRFSRIYGRGMTRNPVYDILKGLESKPRTRTVRGKKVKFYESLNSCYDFICVKDVVRALVLARDKEWENQIMNISSAKGIVLEELVAKVEKIIGEKIDVEVLQDTQSTDILDNTKAKDLGWQPEYSLEEGLRELITR